VSPIKDVKRQLEAMYEAIEALDADLSAGRLGVDEHGRRRAEREREAGRLFVSLRRAQRETRPPRTQPAATAAMRLAWLRNPLVMAPAALLLVAVGVGAGVTASRWLTGPQGGAPVDPPAGTPSAIVSEIELQALRRAADRDETPVPSLLQFAHVALDQGKLDEARKAYGRVLAREPRNVEAITHLGGVLFQKGGVAEALAKVEEALRIDPRYTHWDRTQYLFHGKRDFPAAVKAAEAFLAVVPDGPDAETVRKLMAEARQQARKAAPGAPKGR
jgi:tetratricopeptide (TPR) repeat protein